MFGHLHAERILGVQLLYYIHKLGNHAAHFIVPALITHHGRNQILRRLASRRRREPSASMELNAFKRKPDEAGSPYLLVIVITLDDVIPPHDLNFSQAMISLPFEEVDFFQQFLLVKLELPHLVLFHCLSVLSCRTRSRYHKPLVLVLI